MNELDSPRVARVKNLRIEDFDYPLPDGRIARHPLAERDLMQGQTRDVAYFEPFYLKEFVATKSRDLLRAEL